LPQGDPAAGARCAMLFGTRDAERLGTGASSA
jgi:hypothetical protein